MLEKFVVHIKNIIFLKLLAYFLVIGSLLSLLPRFIEDYNKSLIKNQKVEKALSEAAVKLSSIVESEDKILDSLRIYENTLNISKQQSCDKKIKLINDIKDLEYQFNLSRPITSRFLQIYSDSEGKRAVQFKTKYYDIRTQFVAPDFNKLQEIVRRIYMLMPENSLILSLKIENNEFLDPLLVSELGEQKVLDLLDVKLEVRIRELFCS
ncbi:MAG: hypothetical protein ACRYE9_04295 [Janthinobacterium lividum]